MSSTLDSITAATKLRRGVLEVQRELEAKREDYNLRMARVRAGEEQLAKDREALQDTLVQYYKFIQENEIKRSRATKKAAIEEKQRKEREEHIRNLQATLKDLEDRRDGMKTTYENYAKYQNFLEDVLARNDGDEYQEPKDIMKRWMTLQDNTKVLQQRKTQLEEDLMRNKNSLSIARQKRNTENVALQNQLNELQMTFETLQKAIKIKQDELERKIKQKSATTRTISHISMATKNLFDRCISWTEKYSGRGKCDAAETEILFHELHVISDCLEDFQAIIQKHLRQRANNTVALGPRIHAGVFRAPRSERMYFFFCRNVLVTETRSWIASICLFLFLEAYVCAVMNLSALHLFKCCLQLSSFHFSLSAITWHRCDSLINQRFRASIKQPEQKVRSHTENVEGPLSPGFFHGVSQLADQCVRQCWLALIHFHQTVSRMSLQPTCILCLSLCDGSGFLTIVPRCPYRRPPSKACPVCKKQGYQLLSLSHKSVRPLFQDPMEIMQQSNRVLGAQLLHYRQIQQRMTEALKVLNSKYQQMDRSLKAAKQELHDTKETLRTVQQYTQKQSQEIDALSRGASHAGQDCYRAQRLPSQPVSRQGSEDPHCWPWLAGHPSPSQSRAEGSHSHSGSGMGLGWSATSSVMKRPREGNPSSGGGSGKRSTPSATGDRGAPVPPSTSPLLSTPLVQSLQTHYREPSTATKAAPTPSPLHETLYPYHLCATSGDQSLEHRWTGCHFCCLPRCCLPPTVGSDTLHHKQKTDFPLDAPFPFPLFFYLLQKLMAVVAEVWGETPMSDSDSCSSDSEEEFVLSRLSRHHPLADDRADQSAPPAESGPIQFLCAFCELPKQECECLRCSLCSTGVIGSQKTHCRHCHRPACRACQSNVRVIHLRDARPRSVCDRCAVRSAAAVLEAYPLSCPFSAVGKVNSPPPGLLWGVYVLQTVAEIPNRCVMPHGHFTYLSRCPTCTAPTVVLAPHEPRSLQSSLQDARHSREVEETYFRPYQPVTGDTAEAKMRLIFPAFEDVLSFSETGRPWDILFAAVAASIAYQYKQVPHMALGLSDIPYASLLSLIVYGSRFSILEGPEKTKFIAVPGTHNVRTAVAIMKFTQVQRCVRQVVPDDAGEGQRRTRCWKFQVHAGFAQEADEVFLPIINLLHAIRGGYHIVFCGHSLGGAIAFLLTLKLLEAYESDGMVTGPLPISCVTFGAPIVGSRELYECVQERGWSKCFQNVVHYGDPVPSLPLFRSSLVTWGDVASRVLSANCLAPVFPAAVYMARGAASATANLWNKFLGGPTDWSVREAEPEEPEELLITEADLEPRGASENCCVGRFHFLRWGDIGYITSSDPETSLDLLRNSGTRSVANHTMMAYNRALMLHTFSISMPFYSTINETRAVVHKTTLAIGLLFVWSMESTTSLCLPDRMCAAASFSFLSVLLYQREARAADTGAIAKEEIFVGMDDLYQRATELFAEGLFDQARDTAEQALEACTGGGVQRATLQDHTVFVDTLVLLASIYSASLAFSEAERLLVTCAGYVKDNILPQGSTSSSRDAELASSFQNTALATIAYNRAVLRVDEYLLFVSCHPRRLRCVPHERCGDAEERNRLLRRVAIAGETLLEEAISRLENALGDERRLLADVWHTQGVCHHLLGEHLAALADYHRSLELRLCCISMGCAGEAMDLKMALTLENVLEVYRLLLVRRGCRISVPTTSMQLPVVQRAMSTITASRQAHLGSDHPLVARSLFHEGLLAAEQGRRDTAYDMFSQCLNALRSHTPTPAASGSAATLLGQPAASESWNDIFHFLLTMVNDKRPFSRTVDWSRRITGISKPSLPLHFRGYFTAAMRVGQQCSLGPTPLLSSGAKANGVIVGTQRHLEDANRVLHYFHCLSVEVSAEYKAALKKDSAVFPFLSGGIHQSFSNDLSARGAWFASSEGYKYQLDGWYDVADLVPEAAERTISPSWVEAMERDSSPCEVRYLCYTFQPWFHCPPDALPYLTLPDRRRCYTLYICHRCLSPFFSQVHLTVHLDGYCQMAHPPGEKLYQNSQNMQKVFYVDGARHLHYGRCASLLGKHFIESKLLGNDVDLYEFFVTTIPSRSLPYFAPRGLESHVGEGQALPEGAIQDARAEFAAACEAYDRDRWGGDVVVGYFSRLKQHPNTLSCIVTFPPFQQMRLGYFLLDTAYYLTKVRQTVCGCAQCGREGGRISRPFSPHGQLLLLSYWEMCLQRSLARRLECGQPITLLQSWEDLRQVIDTPIHADDLRFLVVHNDCSFYSSVDHLDGCEYRGAAKLLETGLTLSATLAFEVEKLKRFTDPTCVVKRDSGCAFAFDPNCLLMDKRGQLLYGKGCFHY
eukprot:gene4327-3141_t